MYKDDLVSRFRDLTQGAPDKNLFSYRDLRGGPEGALSRGLLDSRSRAGAALFQQLASAGDRVVVECIDGLAPIIGILSCIYGGMVAVPVPPISSEYQANRFYGIVQDAKPKLIICGASSLARIQISADTTLLTFSEFEKATFDPEPSWKPPRSDARRVAMLQYTSGSTGRPKGVVLRHANILANALNIHEAFRLSSHDICVSWLPIFHDMGLMGSVFQPLLSNFRCLLFSPQEFRRAPLRWLELMSQEAATLSGGPNFAYELCSKTVSKVAEGFVEGLDLTPWRVAYNGSEAVHLSTLQRFASLFGRCGFRTSAFHPCYGLAEATLLAATNANVTEADLQSTARMQDAVDARGSFHRTLSVGKWSQRQTVVIVDPKTREICPDRVVGEIWLSGENVAEAYWRRPKESKYTFRATHDLYPDQSFLRTGDFGFTIAGDLTVVGRMKELIIVGGVNYSPEVIEGISRACHPMFGDGACAAFSVPSVSADEVVVVLQEVRRATVNAHEGGATKLSQLITEGILERLGLVVDVLLVRPKTIPRTTSGKAQRTLCRDLYQQGAFTEAAWELAPASDGEQAELRSAGEVSRFLKEVVSDVTGLPVDSIDYSTPLVAYGIDSLRINRIGFRISRTFDRDMNLAQIADATISELASRLLESAYLRGERQAGLNKRDSSLPESFPLSIGQQSMWLMMKTQPHLDGIKIRRLFSIEGRLDWDRFVSSFETVCRRHPMLRLRIRETDGGLVQTISPELPVVRRLDARKWSLEEFENMVADALKQPMVLERESPFRATCYVRGEEDTKLLLEAHHLAVDLTSLCIVARDLISLYAGSEPIEVAEEATGDWQYSDYVDWQAQMLKGQEGEHLAKFWANDLKVKVEVIDLGRDRTVNEKRGKRRNFSLPAELTAIIRNYASQARLTSNEVLLAAFELVIRLYTGQNKFRLGVVSQGRTKEAWSNIVGNFINPVSVLALIDSRLDFNSHARGVANRLRNAVDHSTYPFAMFIEKSNARREVGKVPLINILWNYQRVHPSEIRVNLSSAFLLGRDGGELRVASLIVRSAEIETERTAFDCTVALVEDDDEIVGCLDYNADCFGGLNAREFIEVYLHILDHVTRDATQPLHTIRMLPLAMEQELLRSGRESVGSSSEKLAHERILEWSATHSSEVAIVTAHERLTYGELAARAMNLARYLLKVGIQAESRVGVCLPRSAETVVSILAIFIVNATYVPLDPEVPLARRESIMNQAKLECVVTNAEIAKTMQSGTSPTFIRLDGDIGGFHESNAIMEIPARPKSDTLAYIFFTSGSSGTPKGVMITHGNLTNFLNGMDRRIECEAGARFLSVTNVTFDISLVELLWTLTRGCVVSLLEKDGHFERRDQQIRFSGTNAPSFSLFYFASSSEATDDPYSLLLEGAKIADRRGLEAVWTPERHFHQFGGWYPNPALTSAAIAAVTERVKVRAGSVVFPLHNPLRIVEEWAAVDNLSKGRVGVALASGWHPDDFVLAPASYEARKEITYRGIDVIRRLWVGEATTQKGGLGNDVALVVHPRPVQKSLPIWLTSGGNADTFRAAAKGGTNVLSHLLGQDLRTLEANIRIYRERYEGQHTAETGKVSLMLHTYLAGSAPEAMADAAEPFKRYLASSTDLQSSLLAQARPDVSLSELNAQDKEVLLEHAVHRYMNGSGLFGTVHGCRDLVAQLMSIGVDEICCLVDFGIEPSKTLQSIRLIAELQETVKRIFAKSHGATTSTPPQLNTYDIIQCTPSFLRLVLHDKAWRRVLSNINTILIGGEPLTPALIKELSTFTSATIWNMYGPTETTIWVAASAIDADTAVCHLGGLLEGTQWYVLDSTLSLVPKGVIGEICIGGRCLARGYLNDPKTTAEKFVPDIYGAKPGGRLYRTGDLGRMKSDGTIEFLGRRDNQIKIRGVRVELEEIEKSIDELSFVNASIVKKEDTPDGPQLVAYIQLMEGPEIDETILREAIGKCLPVQLAPNIFRQIDKVPMTSSGKIDRRAQISSRPLRQRIVPEQQSSDDVERRIARIWKKTLGVHQIDPSANFFEIGGHSLLLVKVQKDLQEEFQCEIPVLKLLEFTTIRTLAMYLRSSEMGRPSAPRTGSLQRNALEARRIALMDRAK